MSVEETFEWLQRPKKQPVPGNDPFLKKEMNIWQCIGWILVSGGLWSALNVKRDLAQCRMSYMWPTYRLITLTRLGNVLDDKYAIFVYEEGGVESVCDG